MREDFEHSAGTRDQIAAFATAYDTGMALVVSMVGRADLDALLKAGVTIELRLEFPAMQAVCVYKTGAGEVVAFRSQAQLGRLQ